MCEEALPKHLPLRGRAASEGVIQGSFRTFLPEDTVWSGQPCCSITDWSTDRPSLLITQEGRRETKRPATRPVSRSDLLSPAITVSKTLAVGHGQELKAVFGNIHSAEFSGAGSAPDPWREGLRDWTLDPCTCVVCALRRLSTDEQWAWAK